MLSVSNIQSNKLNYEVQLLMLVFITVKPNRLATFLVGLILVHNFGRSNFGFATILVHTKLGLWHAIFSHQDALAQNVKNHDTKSH